MAIGVSFMEEKKIIYSGIQPTGCMTLGNYIGAISNWLKMQEDESSLCIYSIVDLHALTVHQVPSEFRSRALSFFAQYLACGLDPIKNIIYFQSHVHEHTELTWVLNCNTYVGEASRMTQFKDKSAKHADNINMGLMDYPILMAADILLYNSALVPIGIDQKQHVELARDIAERFNNKYSQTFNIPEPFIPEIGAKIMSLQDPTSKMNKSDPNENGVISLTDNKDAIMRKFRRAITDSDGEIRVDEDKPGITNLLTIYASASGITIDEAVNNCKGMNYAQLKDLVGEVVVDLISPVQERYRAIMNDKAQILQIAKLGAEKASDIARKTLRKVYKKIGLVQL